MRCLNTIGDSEMEEMGESEEETDVEIERTFEKKGTKQKQEISIEEDPSPSLFRKIFLLFFWKKRRIRTKSMKQKRFE